MVNINAPIPEEYVELVASELGLEVEFKAAPSLEDQLLERFSADESDPAELEPRPPIVTVLGHVDHGKTSLFAKIIGLNVVAGEAGGITQHIRAYLVPTKDGRSVSFVDTPGHEAFTEMRARGTNVTDIAVLVVAADDGVMPQTEEAISHAKAAEVPIVVAMNKIDLPAADEQRVLQQLATAGLLPSEWGGDVEVIRTSAMTGVGIDTLLDTLLVTAELHEYKANASKPAQGMCLEAEQEPGRGVIAKVMVQDGTLKEGDIIVCGGAYGRVKAMFDTLRPRQKLKEAGPSTPVNVTGLDTAPNAGDRFYVMPTIPEARALADQRQLASREQALSGISTRVSFEDFQTRLSEGRLGQDQDVVTLNLIIRADVRGSIEAIQKELAKFDHPEVKLKVLQASVGGVTVADVTLAHASGAVIVGFNVIPDEAARILADERQVQVRRYDIIYKLTDDIKAMIEGKLKPEERIVELGRALVKQAFSISRVGTVAGCQVLQGTIERNARIRVNRENRTIGDYAIDTLRREKDDVKEVSRGMECGIKLVGFNDVKEGDVLEAYKIEEVARTL
jgi:translation initiation factor IF-2